MRLKRFYGFYVADKRTVSHWTSRIADFEESREARVSLVGQRKQIAEAMLQRADELIRKDRRIATSNNATELSVSK